MYATVRTYSEADGLADSLVEQADGVRQLISKIDGFQAYYLIKTADGAVSVSVYDTEAGTNESATAAASFLRDNIPNFSGAAPTVASGEVVLDA